MLMKGQNEKPQKDIDGKPNTEGKHSGDKPTNEKPTHKESHKDKEFYIGEKLSYETNAIAANLAVSELLSHEKIPHKESHKDKEIFIGEKISYEGYATAGTLGIEQRLAVLEQSLALLQHFIPKESRPDLSAAARRLEDDGAKVGTGTQSSTKTKRSPRKKKAKS